MIGDTLQSRDPIARLEANSFWVRVAYVNVLNNPSAFNFQVEQLGENQYANPSRNAVLIEDNERIIFSSQLKNLKHQLI